MGAGDEYSEALSRVLAGSSAYDALTSPQQALVRDAWETRMAALAEKLDLQAEFRTAGVRWVEADDAGRVVERS